MLLILVLVVVTMIMILEFISWSAMSSLNFGLVGVF